MSTTETRPGIRVEFRGEDSAEALAEDGDRIAPSFGCSLSGREPEHDRRPRGHGAGGLDVDEGVALRKAAEDRVPHPLPAREQLDSERHRLRPPHPGRGARPRPCPSTPRDRRPRGPAPSTTRPLLCRGGSRNRRRGEDPRTTIKAMQRTYGRDAGLSFRMFLTMFLLEPLYGLLRRAGRVHGHRDLVPRRDHGRPRIRPVLHIDKIALAASRAKVVERDEAPELHDMVERLCAMADLPKLRIAVVPTDVPNAFATGRNLKNSVVAVTEGALVPAWQARGRGRVRLASCPTSGTATWRS